VLTVIPSNAAEQTQLAVTELIPDGAAQKAGVLIDDILIKYDGKSVSSVSQLNEFKNQVVTDTVEIIVLRAGNEIVLKIPKGPLGVMLSEVLPDLQFKADAVVIANLPKLSWGIGKDNSFLASLEIIANHLEIAKDYTDINGISGAAFRLHFFDGWCPSSPDPTCGYNAGEEALKALGLEYNVMHLAPDGKNKPEIKKAIIESIDKKIPVIAIDLVDTPEWGVITGYQNKGEELLCRTYFDKRNSYEIAQKFPWALYVIINKKQMAKDVDLYRQSFKTILTNLTTEKYDQYYSGINAFNQWIAHLEKTDFTKLDSAKFLEATLANAWIWDRLIADRKDAIIYLGKTAKEMSDLAPALYALKTIYEQEIEILEEPKNIVIYPWLMKSREDWTTEMRMQEIEVLEKAKAKEETALAIWQEINK
jgi:hypothetical protein